MTNASAVGLRGVSSLHSHGTKLAIVAQSIPNGYKNVAELPSEKHFHLYGDGFFGKHINHKIESFSRGLDIGVERSMALSVDGAVAFVYIASAMPRKSATISHLNLTGFLTCLNLPYIARSEIPNRLSPPLSRIIWATQIQIVHTAIPSHQTASYSSPLTTINDTQQPLRRSADISP
jgi:hypothetical protein